MKDDQSMSHFAMPRYPIAMFEGSYHDSLLSSPGILKADLVRSSEKERFELDLSIVRKAASGSLVGKDRASDRVALNNVVTKYGSGLLGVLPHIDPDAQALMGWDGFVLTDDSVSVVDMCREYASRMCRESCGQCFPCRWGSEEMVAILERLCAGQGEPANLDRLENLAQVIRATSKCDIGRVSPRPILDALSRRREDFLKVIREAKPVPKGRYVATVTAPCVNACPSHVDVPAYVDGMAPPSAQPPSADPGTDPAAQIATRRALKILEW